jgi:hypothetical protein
MKMIAYPGEGIPMDVGRWLRTPIGTYHKLVRDAGLLCRPRVDLDVPLFREHEIDGEVLPELSEADLGKLGWSHT